MKEERYDSATDEFDKLFREAFGDDASGLDIGQTVRDPEALKDIVSGIDDEKLQAKAQKLMQSLESPISHDDVLKEFEIDSTIGADLARLNKSFPRPRGVWVLGAAWDAFTNLFKGSVTAPFPSFHARNFMSAFVQNALNGIHDPTKTGQENTSSLIKTQSSS